MSMIQCDSCEELRQNAPNLVMNGLTDTEIDNIYDGNGYGGESDNCTDVNNANDCFIGMMENEVDKYDNCDWKEFMKHFINNVWTVMKSIITWLCGLECKINYLVKGASFYFSETTEGVESKIVKGKGVDFSIRSATSEQHATDVQLVYVGGAVCYITGSLYTFKSSYIDAHGVTQEGNSVWNFEASGYDLPAGGELLYEIRIKKEEYPQIKRLFRGEGWNAGGGQDFFHAYFVWFNEGSYAYGQHGWCDSDGSPSATGYSHGHLVPTGWMYIQCRMLYVGHIPISDRKDGGGVTRQASALTPHGYMGIRLNEDNIEC